MGAICAVILLYWKTLLYDSTIWKKIIIAFLPTGIVGLILYRIIKQYLLGNPWITIVSLFIGGIILIGIEKANFGKITKIKSLGTLSYKQAFLIGLSQTISMIPGTSRAAATIIGGLLVGLNRPQSVEFSFLLAIPTMFAATALDLLKTGFSFTSHEFLLLGMGLLGSFITAYFSVKYFLRFVQLHTLIPFGVYRIVLSLLFTFFLLNV